LSLYHTGPVVRAVSRIQRAEGNDALGGPWLHLLVHALCGMALLCSFWWSIE
jgi:hypothetical protein